jgi:hypothetical protein
MPQQKSRERETGEQGTTESLLADFALEVSLVCDST